MGELTPPGLGRGCPVVVRNVNFCMKMATNKKISIRATDSPGHWRFPVGSKYSKIKCLPCYSQSLRISQPTEREWKVTGDICLHSSIWIEESSRIKLVWIGPELGIHMTCPEVCHDHCALRNIQYFQKLLFS